MLSSILPGFRHVRTPLVIGVLYILAIWLLFANRLRSDVFPTRFGVRVGEFIGFLGPTGYLVALTFSAYLIGSLLVVPGWQTLPVQDRTPIHLYGVDLDDAPFAYSPAVAWRLRWDNWKQSRRKIRKLLRFGRRFAVDILSRYSEFRPEISELVLRSAVARGASVDMELRAWAENKLAPLLNQGLTPEVINNSSSVPGRFKFGLGYSHEHLYMMPEAREIRDKMTADELEEATAIDEQGLVIRAVESHARSDFDSLGIRLQIQRPELFNDVDRLRSEGELRLSLALPLVILVVIAGFTLSNWALLAIALPAVITVAGLRKKFSAEQIVWQALFADEIQSPLVDALNTIPGETELSPPKYRYLTGQP